MSLESAKAFIKRMNTDGEFAKRAISQRGKEQIVSFLKAEGYEFLETEYKCAMQEGHAQELSDEKLNEVAGGGGYAGLCTSCSAACNYFCLF